MKFEIRKEAILKCLSTVERGTGNTSAMPIYRAVLIEAESCNVTFQTNSLDIGITITVGASVEKTGKCCMELKSLKKVVSLMPEGMLSITATEKTLVVQSGLSKIKLPLLDADQFIPVMLKGKEKAETNVLPAFLFKHMVQDVAFAAADSPQQDKQNAIYIESDGDSLSMKAMDGHMLALRTVSLEKSGTKISCMANARQLSSIAAMMPENIEELVTFCTTKNGYSLQFGGIYAVGRLIEGKYYNVDTILSTDHNLEAIIDKEKLFDTVERCVYAANSTKKPAVVEVDGKVMRITVVSPEIDVNDILTGDFSGKPIRLGINPVYLKNVLTAYPDDQVRLNFSSPNLPVSITAEGYHYIVLPCNLKS